MMPAMMSMMAGMLSLCTERHSGHRTSLPGGITKHHCDIILRDIGIIETSSLYFIKLGQTAELLVVAPTVTNHYRIFDQTERNQTIFGNYYAKYFLKTCQTIFHLFAKIFFNYFCQNIFQQVLTKYFSNIFC